MRKFFQPIIFILGLLLIVESSTFAQTKGLIYDPAGAGQSVLDPNLDGYTSETSQGFMTDDEVESEIPYVPLPVIGVGEPSGDLSTGPNCGFTDLVKSNENETIYTYSDGINLMFRFRLGGTADNSKGYTILIDSDQLFGLGSDPDYVSGNPGFEFEITLRTNFGVSIYNVDNNTLTRTEIGDGSIDRPFDDFAQKSIAGSTICGEDYFYDFYVPFADLPFANSTPLRMVGGTVIRPSGSTGGSISDIGGIDDDLGITDDLFEDLIDAFPPTSGDDLNDGNAINPRAKCPSISGPIGVGITSISGTAFIDISGTITAVDGVTVEIFRDGVSQGTTLVSGGAGAWTVSGLATTAANEVFTATARLEAVAADAVGISEQSTSFSNCNASTVGATCSNPPASIANNVGGKQFDGTSDETGTYSLSVYNADGTLVVPSAATDNPKTYTSSPWNWIYGTGGNSAPDGAYYFTITGSGSCESTKTEFCVGTGTSTTPTINTPVVESDATITGTATAGATVTLFIDDVEQSPIATANGSGDWTFIVSALTNAAINEGEVVKVSAVESGSCSTLSSNVTVGNQTAAPTILGDYCGPDGGTISSISGVTASGSGTDIQVYTASTSGGPYTAEGSPITITGASWTVSSLAITVGDFVVATATASGSTMSVNSNEIQALSQTSVANLSITNPIAPNEIREGDANVSGKGTPGYVVYLYIDGFVVDETNYFDTVDGSGDWTITGLNAATNPVGSFDVLYAGGEVGVTAINGSLCESDIVTGGIIECELPVSQTFASTTTTTVCSDETITFEIDATESLIVYQLVDQAGNSLGSAALGDGNALTLIADGLSSSVTSISVKASKIGVTCETTFGSVGVSVEQISITNTFSNPTSCPSPDGSITLSGLNNSQSYTVDYILDGIAKNTTISSNGSGDLVIPNLGPGNYSNISVTGLVSTLICSSNVIAGPVSLVNGSSPILSSGIATDPTTCGGTDGSIALTSSLISVVSYTVDYLKDGVAMSNTLSSDASGNITIPTLSAGNYSNISITNISSSCKSNTVGPTNLSDPNPTIALAGTSNPSTCGGTGTINLSFTGIPDGVGTYTINYDGGNFSGVTISSNSAIILAAAGIYDNLSVTHPTNGCTTVDNPDGTLRDPATHTIAATRTNPTTCGGNGSINLTFTGIADGTTYTIDYEDVANNTQTFTNVTISGNSATIDAPAGTYNNISLKYLGCISSEFSDIVLSDPANPTATPITGDTDVCIGSTIINLTSTTGTIAWFSSAPGVATINATSGVVTPVSAGTTDITYNVTDVNGCSATSAVHTVTVNANPTIAEGTHTQPTSCASPNGIIVLTGVTTGTYDVDFSLNAATQTTQTIAATVGGIAISGLDAGAYTNLRITDASTGCQSNVITGPINLANSSSPTITLGANPTICAGTTSASLTYSATTNSPDLYSIDFSAAANIAGLADVVDATLPLSPISINTTGVAANSYTGNVIVKNSGTGCTSVGQSITIIINALPTATAITGDTDVCIGSTITNLTSTTGTIAWFSSAPGVATINATSGVVTPVSAGTTDITYGVTDVNGCTATSAVHTVTVNALPTITLDTSPSITQGTTSANFSYSATSNAPDRYTINFNATAEIQGFVDVTTTSLPVSPISLVVPGTASSGTYNGTITVINNSTGCNAIPVAFTVSLTTSGPTEICDNGLDDDGDGLIDCYDPDCYGTGGCTDFFYGQNTPTCLNPPAVLPEFTLEEIFRSDNTNAGFDQRSGVMVGDMDGDGIAELVTHDRTDDEILIFNGINGSLKQTINQNQGGHQFAMVALADADGDGVGDIFTTEGGNTSSRIRRYEYSMGGDQGGSTNAIFSTVDLVGTRVNYSSPQLADFNEDGSPEVYVGANIFNAETGALIVQDNSINSGWLNTGTNNGDRLPLAYNIFDNGDTRPAGAGGGTFGSEADGLEFVAGNRVYTVNFSTNSFALAAEITGTNLGDGFVSLGDLDNDNAVDIIVTSEGYVFAWNPRTETQIGSTYDIANTSSGGKANVGDFDNDGIVDIGFAGNNRYVVLEYNSGANTFIVKWQKTGLDDGSQRTGSTLYDFEGDGIAEVVYSEEAFLYIYSGLDGSELTRIPSEAGTRVEYPLVADVNDDGQAEIIVTAQDGNGPGDSGVDDYFVVYKSANSSWVSSREVWNQHGYHVTNINDDMTIPQFQQDIFHPQFGGSLNGFLVQTTYLDQGGDPTYAVPDLVVTASSVDQNCASTNNGLDISMTIQNTGDWKAPATTPITIYDADPYLGVANVIDTVHLPITIDIGQSTTLTTTVSDNGQDFLLYVLVNHNPYESGTLDEITTPLAVGTTNTWVNECDYTNNDFSESIINCNAEPVITDVDVSVNEDNIYTFSAIDFSNEFTDTDGETIDRIQVLSLPDPSEGILYLNGVAVSVNDEIDFSDLTNITFEPVQDFNGPVTFGWNAHDGTEYSLASANVNIQVDPVNDAPLLTLDGDNSGGGADDDGFEVNYTEGDGIVDVVDATDAFASDVDDTQFSLLTITAGGVQDGDSEELTIGGEVFPLGTDNTFTPTIGTTTFSISYVSGVFTITNNVGGEMGIADLSSLLTSIDYQHLDLDNPTNGDRTFTFVVNDGDDNSLPVVSTISVSSTNDAPVANNDPSNELVEDGSTSISLIAANDTDVDGFVDTSTITLIDPSNPSNTGNSSSPLIVTGVGTYSIDASGNVNFTPVTGFTGDSSIDYTVEDDGGAVSNVASIGITVIEKPRITLGVNPSVCEGNTTVDLTYSATSGGADQYSIDYDDVSFTDLVNASLTTSLIGLNIPGGTTDGSYTATLTVSNSINGYVSDDHAITIIINDTPSVGAAGNDPTTCNGTDGNIVISGVKNAISYSVTYTFNSSTVNTSISSGGSGNSLTITNLAEGTYTNISVENLGCSSNTIASVELTDPAPVTIALGTTNDPTTCNGINGSIQITGLATSTNYVLGYNENAAPQSTSITSTAGGTYTLSGLSSGTYENFEVTAANCTSNTIVGPINLSDPSAPTIMFDSDQDPASCSSTDGFIILSSLTSGRDYQYSYTKNAVVSTGTLTADVDGKITILHLPAGTYTSVFVDDVLTGCQSNVIPALVLNPPDIVLGTTQNALTCSGIEGSFQVNGLAASTTYDLDYDLDGMSATTVGFTSNATGEHSVIGLRAGAYTNIRVTNSGCVSNMLSVTLIEPIPAVIAQGTVTDPTTCGGNEGSIQLTGLEVSASYTLDYLDDGTPMSTTIGSDGSGNLLITGLEAGTYTNISVAKDNCISNTITSVALNDPAMPVITLGADPTECAGVTATSISYTSTSGTPDRYSIDFDTAAEAEGFIDVTDVTLTAGNIAVAIGTSTAGIYNATLTVTNATTSCTSVSHAISITVNENPSITLGVSPEVCQGEISADLLYSLATGSPDQYEIDFDASAEAQGFVDVSGIGLGTSPISIAVPSAALVATYNATIKVLNTTNGCESSSTSFTIKVNDKPTIALGDSPNVCVGTISASLPYISVSGGADQYIISFDGSAQAQGFADVSVTALPTNPVSITVPGSAVSDTYNATISVINSTTGCVGDGEAFTVTLDAIPDITLGASPSICIGQTSGDLVYSSVSGGANEYNIDFDATAEGQGFADVTSTVLPSSPIGIVIPSGAIAGTYNASLTVNNSSTGCISSVKPITVTVNDNPTFTLGSNPEVCEGVTMASISYSVLAGSPDQYSIDYAASAEGEGFSDVALTSLGASPMTINIPAATAVNIYNATISLINSTTGCTSSAIAFSVTINAEPTISLGVDPEFCEGETAGSIPYTALVGSPDLYSIDFTDGSFTDITNQVITASQLAFTIPGGTTAGTYAATMTVSNSTTSCTSTTYNFNAIVKNTPAITAMDTDPTTCAGTDGIITLQGLNDAVTYDVFYNLDGNPVNTTATPAGGDIVISGLEAGAYSNIKVIEDGCDSNEIALITLSDPATATLALTSQSDPTTCGGTDGEIRVNTGIANVISYTVDYDFNSSAQSVAIMSDGAGEIIIGSLAAGQYENIKVTANGCESNELSGPFNLVDPTAPTISFTDGNNSQPTTCAATDGVIAIFGVADNTSYDYDYTYGGSPVNGTTTSELTGNELRITGLNAGTYTDVSVTLTGCQSNTLPSIVLNPPDITLGTIEDPSNCGGANGSIEIVGFAASTAYTINYDLDGNPVTPFGINSDVNGEFIIAGLAAGAYTNITAENSGCTTSPVLNATLNDPASPAIAEGAHSNPNTCGASDGIIQITGLSASTSYDVAYTFNNVVTNNTLAATSVGIIEITGLAAGSYTNITATLLNCESNPLAVVLDDPTSPDFSLGSTEFPECIGTLSTSTTYTINSGTAETYSIDYDALANSNGFVDVVDAVLSGGTITFNIPGTAEDRIYGAMVTVKNTTTNCTSNTEAVSLSMGTVPTINFGTFPEVCNGTSATTLPYNSTTGTPDEYSIDFDDAGFTDIPFTVLPGAMEFPIAIPAVGAGVYPATLLVQNTTTGCVSESIPFTITINENPNLTLGINPEVCAGETTASITYSGATGSPDQYTIDFDATAEGQGFVDVPLTSLPGSPIDIIVPATATASTYNADLVVTNSTTGCSSTTLPFMVTVNGFPSEPIVNFQVTGITTPTITGNADNGSNITVIVGGATYTTVSTGAGWSVNTGDMPASGTFVPNTNGINEVQVTSESNGCSISDTSNNELTIDTTDPIAPTVENQVTNDPNPTITGTAEPNSTVTVVTGGATFIVTTDASGNWSVDTNAVPNSGIFNPDINGSNEVQVTSTDAAGNSTSDATTLELTIDTTDPAVPTVASQTTNDITPVLTGTAEPNSTVTIVVGGATYTTIADGSGNWVLDTGIATPDVGTFNPNINGGNEVLVTSTDAAGNSTSDATTLELIIDTSNPVVPTVENQVTNDITPVLTGTAEAGSTLTVLVGGATFITIADGSGSWSIDSGVDIPVSGTFNPNTNGANEVQVTSTDEAGNSSVDVSNLELTIDTTDPVVPTIANQTTSDTTPLLTGTAEAGSTVTIIVGGATYTTTADGSGNWMLDTESTIPDSGIFNPDVNGGNEVQVTSTDAAGNTTSDTTTLELIIDTTDPVVPTVANQTTNDTTPVLTGTAEAGSTVTIVVGGATYTTTADGAGNWTLDTESAVADSGTFNPDVNGDNEVLVTSNDAAGNSNSDLTTLELTIDTIDPVVPTVVSQTTNDTTPTLAGTAEAGSTVTIVVGGATYITTADGSGNWTLDTGSAIPDSGTFNPDVNGDNEVQVTSTDAAGNSTSDATTLELTIDTTDPVVPTVVSQTTNDITPVLSGTAEAGSTVTILVRGATYIIVADGSGNWSIDTELVTPDSGTFSPDVNGTNEVSVTSSDAAGNSTSDSTMGELIIDQNDSPVAVSENISTDEDVDVVGTLLNNVSDPENQNLTFALLSTIDALTEGVFSLNADGTYTFEPVENFSGALMLTYEVCDDGSPILCDQETINIVVNAVNDFPVATGETITIDEDNVGNGDLSDNVTDVEGDNMTFSLISGPDPSTEGTLTLNPDGTYTFIPVGDFNGTVAFVYEVCDDGNPIQCAQATSSIVVNSINDIPIAQDDIAGVNPGNSVVIPVLNNDSDPENNALTVSQITIQPLNGIAVINADGTITYTPNAGFDNNTDTFTYEVCDDGTPSECTTASVTVSVPEQEFAPTAVDDIAVTNEDGSATGNVLDNDSDGNGDVLTVNTTPVSGPTNGTLILNADGTYTYTPDPNFNGADSFTYEVCDDATPALCSQATTTITVNPVNDAPVTSSETLTIDEDNPGNGDLSDNVTDLEGNNLMFSLISGPNPATEGTLTLNPDGTYTFVPVDGFNGSTSFTYEVCDDGSPVQCVQANVAIVVNAVNDRPIANDDLASTDPAIAVIISVLSNDTDPEGNNLTISQITSGPANGTIMINGDGTVTYTPDPGFNNGTDTFTYEVCDDGSPSECASATVTVSVPEEELAPVAVDDFAVVDEDGNITENVLNNDSDGNNDILTVNTTPISAPTNGILVLNSDGSYAYSPEPGFSGTDSFSYEVCDDGSPIQCAQATVTITVNEVNDPPIATPETVTTDEETATSGTLADNATDEDSGSLTFSVTTTLDPVSEGVFTLNSDGTYTFIPADNFSGTLMLTYEVCDDSSPALCDQESITVTVNPINDAPVATDEQIVQDGFDQINDTLTGLVSDPDGDVLTYSIVNNPANGMLTINGDGTYSFVPDNQFFGTVSFEYEVCDNVIPALCDQATVSITITQNGDTDGDGIIDADEDTDNDGDPTNDDCDGDSIPNYLDTDPCDADGDGLLDGEDTDGDGNPYNDDCDGDGIPNFQDTDPCDTDGDGINDNDEDTDGDGDVTNDDCDSDGNPNYRDVDPCDSDGDGILDNDEDTDGDGNPYNDDCDGDTIPNFLDTDPCDTDADGVFDDDEDSNNDGNPYNDDCDNDGIPNFQDSDSCDTDGDGILDSDEDTDGDGDPSNDDCDADGTPNFMDADPCDTDGDGVLDNDEDTDGDGNPYNDDCDGDGTPNFQDADVCDSDGDGIFDDDEDTDNDGDPYNDDCDEDGTPNFQDTDPCDTDGDGLDDAEEDTDNDGNPYNDDCDADGTPDFQDADSCSEELETTPVLTPNGDTINDLMEIEGIENFPDNEIRIYNRWGNLVWETVGYDNTSNAFGGFRNSGLLSNNGELPDGTYFIIIDKGDGSELQKDFVVIKR